MARLIFEGWDVGMRKISFTKLLHIKAGLTLTEAIYSTYDLRDIEAVYDLMLKYYPDDLQLWTDAICFNFNVLDNEEKVREMVSKLAYKINSVSRQIDDIRKELG